MQNLLDLVYEMIKRDKELRALQHEGFNVFHLCRVDHYENYHSRIIAEFLNSNGSHGFGNLFLREFINCILENSDQSDNFNFAFFENAKVNTEFSTNKGRFDIFVHKENHGAFIIENKIYANEMVGQLQGYSNYLQDNHQGKGFLFYLTINGRKSADTGFDYTPISYSCVILPWLTKCISLAAEAPYVRETLRQYRNLIKELTGDTMTQEITNEICAVIIKNKENFEAAKTIADSFYSTAYGNRIKTIVTQCKPDDMEVCDIRLNEKYPYFDYSNPDSIYTFRFQFQSSNFRDLAFGLFTEDKKENLEKPITLSSEPHVQIEPGVQKMFWQGYEMEGPNKHGWIISTYMKGEFRNWTTDFLITHWDDQEIKDEITRSISLLRDIIKENSCLQISRCTISDCND